MKTYLNGCKMHTDIMRWLCYLAEYCRTRNPPTGQQWKPAQLIWRIIRSMPGSSVYETLISTDCCQASVSSIAVCSALGSTKGLFDRGCNQRTMPSFGYDSNAIFTIILYRGPLNVCLVPQL